MIRATASDAQPPLRGVPLGRVRGHDDVMLNTNLAPALFRVVVGVASVSLGALGCLATAEDAFDEWPISDGIARDDSGAHF